MRFSTMEFRGERLRLRRWGGSGLRLLRRGGEVDSHFFERVLLPAALAFGQATSSPWQVR